MATLKLAITPDKVAKDGTHKIRIALGHKSTTRYIVTRFKVNSLSQFKNGQVVKRPDAALINTKLRNILNEYQEKS
jgi:tagatose-1,6-bisphosphate aldolase non-catalytic subunit AgaZ/GatZ